MIEKFIRALWGKRLVKTPSYYQQNGHWYGERRVREGGTYLDRYALKFTSGLIKVRPHDKVVQDVWDDETMLENQEGANGKH
jgi:hypothetical protein